MESIKSKNPKEIITGDLTGRQTFAVTHRVFVKEGNHYLRLPILLINKRSPLFGLPWRDGAQKSAIKWQNLSFLTYPFAIFCEEITQSSPNRPICLQNCHHCLRKCFFYLFWRFLFSRRKEGRVGGGGWIITPPPQGLGVAKDSLILLLRALTRD